MSERLIRVLTEKAMAGYEEKVEHFYNKLKSNIAVVEQILDREITFSINSSILALNQVRDEVTELFQTVQETYSLFIKYLEDTRTVASQAEVKNVDSYFVSCESKVGEFLNVIRQIRTEKLENMSVHLSTESVHSQTVQKNFAEAETAKAKLQFAEEELRLNKERSSVAHKQADIDAELSLIKLKKETAALAAEASAYERLSNGSSVASEDRMDRVRDFVNEVGVIPPSSIHKTKQSGTGVPDGRQQFDQSRAAAPDNAIVQFLLRKDLLLSRLSHFNDSPENHEAWKGSFKSVSSEMNVTTAEEIDLLIKWLGASSKKHAISLKTAYVSNPDEGLCQIWNRLDERFGAAENVYNVTAKKLSSFPKVTRKDPVKLYELSDLLAQIQGLMEDPKYETTLSYFNSSAGVNPIIAKLPHELQQKWVTHATNYKTRYTVTFPPFSEFAEFVKKYSKVWNDPSFCFEVNACQSGSNVTKPSLFNHRQNTVLSSAKTEVDQSSVRNEKSLCPIHKAPHSLENCRTFESKSMEEKRKILSENKLCFKCFLPGHTIKECRVQVECSKCFSKRHRSIMHISRPNQEGGESSRSCRQTNDQGQQNNVQVYSKCTDVCHEEVHGKSCAKIVLVKAYKKDNPSNLVSCYAILDEQSNRSLAKPDLFTQLDVKGESCEYSLTSCSGFQVRSGRRASDIVIESVDSSVSYELPILLECSEIPSNRNEIPTPSAAISHPHLVDIATVIPDIDDSSQILLLLGRDITDVHHVLDQRVGPRGAPYAQRLPLGWVIVGEVCLGNSHLPVNVSVNKTFIVGDESASLLPPCPNKLFENGHAEIAPELPKGAECWYLPIFGVYHPKKPDKIRVVFDSSAQCEGVSLNSVLLQGPNLTNSLLGILMRFRRNVVAVAADIEQMFYCFGVDKSYRDYLRFIWHQVNDLSKPLIEYRMCKHVFWNSPSPAVATFGLRNAVETSEKDVQIYVEKDFYVDDGLMSCSSVSKAVYLLQRTQKSLAVTGLRLHKILSNDPEVMKSLPRHKCESC